MWLQTDRCVLRSWRMEDAEGLAAGINNGNVGLRLRDWIPHPYTVDDANAYLQRVTTPQSEHAVCIEVDGKVSGGMSIRVGSDVHRRTAELGYWLAEPLWGRGIMTAAVRAFVSTCFAEFELDRIFATTASNNPASAHVLTKAGFTFEGRLRKNVIKDGEVLDALMFAWVRDDASPPNAGQSTKRRRGNGESARPPLFRHTSRSARSRARC
ncbi:MAG TPA: GNAT family protein [Chthoniobacterales bacterium]|nr:GNAT family protein [Chthoniobacterales bacterium]